MAEVTAQQAEAKAKTYSQQVAAMEREREKEIAIHVAREEHTQRSAAEAEAERKLLQGKASPQTLEKVRKAAEGWRIAWQRRDLDKYMSYYSDDVQITKVTVDQGTESTMTLSKSGMRRETEGLFAQNMQFSIDEPSLEAGSDAVRATFNFFKRTPSATYGVSEGVIKHDMWIRKLLFRSEVGQWKITSENWRLYKNIPEYSERP